MLSPLRSRAKADLGFYFESITIKSILPSNVNVQFILRNLLSTKPCRQQDDLITSDPNYRQKAQSVSEIPGQII